MKKIILNEVKEYLKQQQTYQITRQASKKLLIK
jgi:hypothetical protein